MKWTFSWSLLKTFGWVPGGKVCKESLILTFTELESDSSYESLGFQTVLSLKLGPLYPSMQGTDGALQTEPWYLPKNVFHGLSSSLRIHSQTHLQLYEVQYVGSQVWISWSSKIKTKIVRRINMRFSAFLFRPNSTHLLSIISMSEVFNVHSFPQNVLLE